MHLFRSQEDYVKKITDDDVINILGTKGSGKTTASLPYLEDDDAIVVNCDRLLELPSSEKEDKELQNIRELLKKKVGEIPTGEAFTSCYQEILKYISSKKKKAIIEGNVIQEIPPQVLKGTIIMKRTGIIPSYIRAVKRDYPNEYFLQQEKEKHKYFYKVTRFFNIAKRRKSIFQQAKEMDQIIQYFENLIKS